LDSLKKEILQGLTLKRPNPDHRFYVKTDWSAWAQGAVLLQADVSEEAEASMWREIHGGQYEFDKAIKGLRLRPIKFISLLRKESSPRHSFVGEASTGRWAFLKLRRQLMGREFTWITGCSGVKNFFETDYEATHMQQRWKLELPRFDFMIVHRPGRMLTEYDMLSRYNTWTSAWRNNTDPTEIPRTAVARKEVKNDEAGIGGYDEWTSDQTTRPSREEMLHNIVQQQLRPISFTMTHPQVK
jgi:hypothetical protein